MTEVRKHQRKTASGKTTTVRHHTRNTGSGTSAAEAGDAERARAAWAERAAPHVSTLPPAAPAVQDEDWWDGEDETPAGDFWAEPEPPSPAFGRMAQEMRDWRSRPEPVPSPEAPQIPAMERLLGCDTPEGRARYDRLRAYREAGYTGPLDSEGRIPDPDDPANHESLSALAYMSETHG